MVVGSICICIQPCGGGLCEYYMFRIAPGYVRHSAVWKLGEGLQG